MATFLKGERYCEEPTEKEDLASLEDPFDDYKYLFGMGLPSLHLLEGGFSLLLP